jgi:DNA replication and repair protein RecF
MLLCQCAYRFFGKYQSENMTISQLSLTNFRGLKSTTLNFHPHVNLITGNNGTGKTSLLESINVIVQASSFQTHRLKNCISHSDQQLLLFARFENYKVGLSKSYTKLNIKINGEAVNKRSVLVKKTPASIINADSFQLITGSPSLRRSFIDWCLFHVEHEYAGYFAQAKHALKQRNSILKSRKNINLVDYWDKYLIEPSLVICELRQKYSIIIASMLNMELKDLLGEVKLDFKYDQGWPVELTLEESMIASRHRDIKSGFTNCGIHRDNIKLSTNALPVTDVLSRGQLKRICIALHIIRLKIVKSLTSKSIILLVDDISSELDDKSETLAFKYLLNLGVQLFITNINDEVPSALKNKEFKMFHVEHGIISARKIS